MDKAMSNYGAAALGGQVNVRTSAVDQVNQRLNSIQDAVSQAVSRVNMIANKMTGAIPPTEKAGAPIAIPSCSIDWLNDIDNRLNELSNAITRLD